MKRKPLTPDEIVERALKRLPKVAPEILDEEFQPRTVTVFIYGYGNVRLLGEIQKP